MSERTSPGGDPVVPWRDGSPGDPAVGSTRSRSIGPRHLAPDESGGSAAEQQTRPAADPASVSRPAAGASTVTAPVATARSSAEHVDRPDPTAVLPMPGDPGAGRAADRDPDSGVDAGPGMAPDLQNGVKNEGADRNADQDQGADPDAIAGADRNEGADRNVERRADSGAAQGTEQDTEQDTDHDTEQGTEQHGSRVRHWRELSRKRNSRAKRPWWIELPILIVIAFLLTFLIQTFVARVYYVPSGSMEHTLHGTTSGGDRILAFKLVYDFRDPEQGEVVVFKGPSTWTPEANIPGPSTWIGKVGQALGSVVGIAPPNEKDYVKRVIAVGGQTVSCCDAQGRVQVDGVSLDEPYLFMDPGKPAWAWTEGVSNCDVDESNPTRFQSFRCFGPYTVPEGTVWVMGDHRSDSADSSYQCRGLVPSATVHCQGPIPVDDVIGKAVFIVMPPSRWGGIGSPDIMSSAGGG